MGMDKNNLKATLNQKSQFDFIRKITNDNIWYYKDRINTTRGPCDLSILRICYSNGIIDENTLVWGNGLDSWLCIKNVKGLMNLIRIPEVQLAYWLKKEMVLKPLLNEVRDKNVYKRRYWSNIF